MRSVVALVGRFPVLAGADFDLAPGEIVAVVGVNGAGKTSLLRVIAGLIAVRSGELTVLGTDLRRERRSHRCRIGMIGHDPFLYDELTVRENVDYFVRLAGSGAGADVSRVDEALATTGLDGPLEDMRAHKLSAGQRRRCAVAVLVARSPELLLLDEPHAGLDARSREMFDEVLFAAAARGASVVFSSHEPATVNALAHRRVTVDGGMLASTSVGATSVS